MQHPQHQILMPSNSNMTPQRIGGIGFVIALHLVILWAIVSGLAVKALKYIPPSLEATVITTPDTQQKPISVPKPTLVVPQQQENSVTPPQIVVDQTPSPTMITTTPSQPSQQSVPDSAAAGVTSTHTTPPYPGDAKRLGEQGTTQLHITISADGTVTGAQVTASSGFPDLDQTAVSWVTAHWKYKPAILNGVPVASAADANVVFNLKNAR